MASLRLARHPQPSYTIAAVFIAYRTTEEATVRIDTHATRAFELSGLRRIHRAHARAFESNCSTNSIRVKLLRSTYPLRPCDYRPTLYY
jgi:hypothetical protein